MTTAGGNAPGAARAWLRRSPVARKRLAQQDCLLVKVIVDREAVLKLLAEHKPRLVARYGVTELAPFGSIARGAADTASDVDVLVAFDGPATSARYFGVMFYLEDLLGRPVDLVTVKALREELRPPVEREAVYV